MKMRRNCVRILACVGLCLGFMETGLAAEGMDFPVVYESEENIGNSQIAASMNQIVSVSDWKRRIYQAVYSVDTFEGDVSAIRAYAGANFHFTDSQGNILSEGTYIDKSGNISADFTGGRSLQRCKWLVYPLEISGYECLAGKPGLYSGGQ